MQVRAILLLLSAAIVLPGGSWAQPITTTATPTPVETPGDLSCARLPCAGSCALCPPCTPGTICPKAPCLAGRCEAAAGSCVCIVGGTEAIPSPTATPTPTVGGCADACDSRPCVGQCPDGSLAHGLCTSLTIDRGCACSFGCAPATPLPTFTPSALGCFGDCNGDSRVDVSELIIGVDMALGVLPPNSCPPMDCDCSVASCLPGVDCILRAVNNVLVGCPTPLPTATPIVTVMHYELVAGSTITYVPPPEAAAPIPPEPLMGAFEVMPTEPQEGNSLFAFAVTRIALQSAHFTVKGDAGSLTAVTIPEQGFVELEVTATIEGEDVSLYGVAPLSVLSGGTRPAINGLEISGGGYTVTIFAEPLS
jgi:hypothetical protein